MSSLCIVPGFAPRLIRVMHRLASQFTSEVYPKLHMCYTSRHTHAAQSLKIHLLSFGSFAEHGQH